MNDSRDDAGRFGLTRRGYVLLMLTALSAMNQLDRQLINILIEPIRHEFGLGDVQLGLLSGFAFVVLFGTLSVPAAIYAARFNRRNLLAAAAVIWGGMTMLGGFAQSYTHLLLTRLGVGLGEAGGMPPSHAMISDLYEPEKRGAAMATWSSGINIGVFFAFLTGGLIGGLYGWRTAFVVAGMATVVLALILRGSVAEPLRRAGAGGVTPPAQRAGLMSATAAVMWRDPVLRQIWIGGTLTATTGYASLAWMPAYMVRSHGLTIAQVGLYFALVVGIGGAIGAWLGGILSDRARSRDIRWSIWIVAALLAGTKPLVMGFLLIDTTALALALFVLPGMIGAVYLGPSLAILHNRVDGIDANMRPMVSALYLLVLNVVGLGVGPVLAGALSQWVFTGAGTDSLRYALVTMQVAAILATAHFYIAGRRLTAA